MITSLLRCMGMNLSWNPTLEIFRVNWNCKRDWNQVGFARSQARPSSSHPMLSPEPLDMFGRELQTSGSGARGRPTKNLAMSMVPVGTKQNSHQTMVLWCSMSGHSRFIQLPCELPGSYQITTTLRDVCYASDGIQLYYLQDLVVCKMIEEIISHPSAYV